MSIEPGTRLGPYQVGEQLGSGGMGEVYKAQDTRLDRSVAIKVLPRHLADRADLRERFEREARTVSSLNHPNVCTLFDIGKQDGVDYLVMEYLEGETLAARLARAPLPLEQALEVAVQMADALDKAHRQGVTHRDLKPGNIMLTKSGSKLLDFGLAKQARPAAQTSMSALPTGAGPLTVEGTLLGTLQYMSPEQLEGQEADPRTDIFAFGAVLHEMITGRKAFDGKSQVSVIAAIIDHDPPPMSSLQPVSPPLLDHLVKTCLTKNPDKRWQTMADVLIQLKLIVDSGAELAAPQVTSRMKRRQRMGWGAAAVLFAASIVLAAVALLPRAVPEPAKISFEIPTPSAPNPIHPAISPDGAHVVAIVTSDRGNVLWVRALDNLNANIVPGSEGAAHPFWSPDGRFIAFFADGKLKKVDLRGAPPQTLCDAAGGNGGTWNRDDVIVFAPTIGPLFRVSAAGGVAAQLTELDQPRQETSHRQPFFLPDGKHFLYVAASGKDENSGVYVGSLDSKERKFLLSTGIKVQFVSDNLLFLRENTLMAQRFDPVRLELQGDPFRIAEHVGFNPINSAAGFTASSNALVLRLNDQGGNNAPSDLRWFDRTGKNTETVGASAAYHNPMISPDLQHIAVAKQEGSAGDIWILDLMRGTTTRLTFDPGNDTAPLWSPDGSRIVFQSNRSGTFDLYQKNSSGIGQDELLLKSDHAKTPVDWSADGRFLLYRDDDPKTGADLWALSMTGEKTDEKKAVPVVQSPFNDYQGRFSPDARFIAYVSNESGQDQVYVQGFPNAVSRWQISTNVGHHPRWRRDGKELFFMGGGTGTDAMAVDVVVSSDGALKAGVPHKLFQISPAGVTTDRNTWDITPDGQRFLVDSSPTGVIPLTVIVNWLSKAKAN